MKKNSKQKNINKNLSVLHVHLCDQKHVPSIEKDALAYFHSEIKKENNFVSISLYPEHRLYILIKDQDTESCRRMGSRVWSWMQSFHSHEATLHLHGIKKESGMALTEGIHLSSYKFVKYKKEGSAENKQALISFSGTDFSQSEKNTLGSKINSVFICRDLVNEPPDELHSVALGKVFEQLGKKHGFKVEVFNKARIEALKMAGLLAVNRGSKYAPTFSVMQYCHPSAKKMKPVVLVGKGVVYDTGGYNIKVGSGMENMKCDMAGAAAVGSTLALASSQKWPIHLIGLVPSTDNFINSSAYVAGSIIRYSNGVTAEVQNTDAEGRLILADALIYAARYKPQLVIDFATLTGAAAAAIGKYGAVGMCNNSAHSQMNHLLKCGESSGDRIAQFPFWDDYAELIKSDIAEIKNLGGPYAGAITAGKFLERFVDYPWIHLDIAGPSFLDADWNYRKKGGTGYGVMLMHDFLRAFSSAK
ncbi:MAG: leucyl aminopeptidase family protein [Bacteroidota bacterium]|jgi:leucyl aminopeptidase